LKKTTLVIAVIVFIFVLNIGTLHALIGDPELVFDFKFGTKENSIAGDVEDKNHVTDGFPPAFAVDLKENLYILDSGNYRVLIYDKSKKNKVLFNYNKNKIMIDITILQNGKVVLASSNSVLIYDKTGKELCEIEGVYPRDIYSVKNDIFIYNYKLNIIMKFSQDGVIKKSLEGAGFFPVSPNGKSIMGMKIDHKTYYLFEMNFDGISNMIYTEELKNNEYVCNVKPSGFDIMGNLYYEVLYGHDIDKKKEKHEYRLDLYKFDMKTKKVIKKIATSPFRYSRTMLAPRQYVNSKRGNVFTYETTDSGYQIYKYKFNKQKK
jgi:hypothetical protein